MLGLGVAAGAGLYAAASRWMEPAMPQPAAVQAPGPASGLPAAPAAAASLAVPAARAPAPGASAPQPTLLREVDQAWRELAQVWKLPVPQQGDPCTALQREGVQCFSRTLSLPVIRELGRPGILTLDAATGSPRYALLTGLTRDSATLQAGGSEQTVTLTALAQRWEGGFATLWRSPPGYSGRSDHPETIAWMAKGLAKATGAPEPSGPATLDGALRSRLRAFQTAQGLAADGQPGPMTFMQLNRAAGVDEPRLHSGS